MLSNSGVINEFTIKCGLCLSTKQVPTERKVHSRVAYFKKSKYFLYLTNPRPDIGSPNRTLALVHAHRIRPMNIDMFTLTLLFPN